MNETTAIIIGAGPTGLILACELARYNIPFLIFDKKPGPTPTSNALAIHARSLEVLAHMGIADSFIASGTKLHAMNLYDEQHKLCRITLDELPSPFPFVLGIPQSDTEKLLEQQLNQLGHQVHRKHVLKSFQQKNEQIDVCIEDVNSLQQTYQTKYLFACDGAHSTIREQLALPFTGSELGEQFIMIDAKCHWPLSYNELHAFLSPDGPMAAISMGNDYSRVLAQVSERNDKPTLEDFNRIIKHRCPFELTLSEPTWTSSFQIHRRIVPKMRQGNIFLLGDAAHIHSPVGGQGMNTGMQDAFNLAWKIAYVEKGFARDALLESFHAERHPVAEEVLNNTTKATQMITIHSKLLMRVRNQILKLLSFSFLQKYIRLNISELAINYRQSPIVTNCYSIFSNFGARLFPSLRAGDRAPLDKDLLKLLCGTKHHLFIFNKSKVISPSLRTLLIWLQKYTSEYLQIHIVCKHTDHTVEKAISWIDDDVAHWFRLFRVRRSSLVLIRPDQYIGFRGTLMEPQKFIFYMKNLFAIDDIDHSYEILSRLANPGKRWSQQDIEDEIDLK